MIISQLKEEIFELRRNQVHYEKLAGMVDTLETKCRGFEKEKVNFYLVSMLSSRIMNRT